MAIKVRPHHFICLTFFRGRGYNLNFIRNVKRILKEIGEKGVVEVVEGCDDICLECPHRAGNRCVKSEDSDAEVKRIDSEWLKVLELNFGEKAEIFKLVKEKVTISKLQSICKKCEWLQLCLKTAKTLNIKP